MARLFLGDVGSLPIGLLLGWLLVLLAGNGHLAAALLLPLYYLADATLTLLRRIANGEPFWQAHRTHFYQRATDRGFSVPAIVARVFAVNVALVALAIGTVVWPGHRWIARAALACWRRLVGWLLVSFARGKTVTRDPGHRRIGLRRPRAGRRPGAQPATPCAPRCGSPPTSFRARVEVVAVSDLTRPVEWRALLKGVETVVHLAGIAHAGAEHRRGRLRPGQSARRPRSSRSRRSAPIGIRHLVFVSSIRAQSGPTRAQAADARPMPPQPTDAYGRSKLAAEEAVRAVERAVHDPAAGADLRPGRQRQSRALMRTCADRPGRCRSALCRNRRSLLARENLIAAIHFVLEHAGGATRPIIVADPAPLTLAEIVAALRAGAGPRRRRCCRFRRRS